MSKQDERSENNDLSEFESTMRELESFSKANTGVMTKGMEYTKPGDRMEDDDDDDDEYRRRKEKAKEKEKYAEGDMDYADATIHKSAQYVDGDETAMDAEDFLQKSHAMFSDTLSKSSKTQSHASALMAQGMIAQGRMLKSLMGELSSIREELVHQGGLPKMRKSILSLHERESAMTSQSQAQSDVSIPRVLLAKAHGANGLIAQGKLTPATIGIVERCANRGEALPAQFAGLAQFASVD